MFTYCIPSILIPPLCLEQYNDAFFNNRRQKQINVPITELR